MRTGWRSCLLGPPDAVTIKGMNIAAPFRATHPIHTVHRVGIGAVGLFLLLFGSVGLIRRLPFASVRGQMVVGLSTNGLLATISLVVCVVLIAAAIRGGHAASTVGMVIGALFLISGVANIFLIGTTMNMLAFRLSNVIFSLVVGMVLLFTGAYGRIASQLPPDNPYFRSGRDGQASAPEPEHRTAAERVSDQFVDGELAEAERAVAGHYASAEQLDGVRRAGAFRTVADRRRAFRAG